MPRIVELQQALAHRVEFERLQTENARFHAALVKIQVAPYRTAYVSTLQSIAAEALRPAETEAPK